MSPIRGRHSTHSVGSSQQVRHNELGFLTVDDKLLADLEFDAVRTALQAETATPLGALRGAALRPSGDPQEVAREQAITLESLRHLESQIAQLPS